MLSPVLPQRGDHQSTDSMIHVSRIGLGIETIEEVEELSSTTLTLNLHSNLLTTLRPLHHFTNLVDLNVSDNRILTIDGLHGLFDLTALNLASNQVQDCSGLAGLSSLKRLHLQFNAISSLAPLAGLHRRAAGLEYVDLRGNCYHPLREYSVLSNLRRLKHLIVDHSHGSMAREFSHQDAQPWVSELGRSFLLWRAAL